MTLETRPLLPAPSCARECLPVGFFRNAEFIGLSAEDGAAVCDDCLGAVAGREGVTRLLLPLRRSRRNDPQTKVTCRWDEALDSLVRAVEGLAGGSSHLVWIQGHPAPRLTNLVGRRVGHMVTQATLVRRCPPREATGRLLDSLDPAIQRATTEDLAQARRLVIWGCDPGRVPWWIEKGVGEALAAGAKMLTVDPARGSVPETRGMALGLRPGTDVPLALSLLSGARNDARKRWKREEEWEKVLKRWDPSAAAKPTGVPESRIAEAIQFLNSPGKGVLLLGGGPAHHPGGGEAVRAVAALGHIFDMPLLAPQAPPDPSQGLPEPIPAGRFEDVTLETWETHQSLLKPEQTMIILEGMEALPPWRGLRGMESFLSQAKFVAVLTERSACDWIPADLVLPVADVLETSNSLGFSYRGTIRQALAAFPPPRDLPTLWSLGHLLASRLGWPESWFPGDGQVPEAGPGGTKPGLVVSLDPPAFVEPGEGPLSTPELFSSFRLVLLWSCGPSDPRVFGEHPLVPRLQIAPQDARNRALTQDTPVVIHNERGQVAARVLIDPDQTEGTVVLFWPKTVHPAAAFVLFPSLNGGKGSGDTFGSCLVEVQK